MRQEVVEERKQFRGVMASTYAAASTRDRVAAVSHRAPSMGSVAYGSRAEDAAVARRHALIVESAAPLKEPRTPTQVNQVRGDANVAHLQPLGVDEIANFVEHLPNVNDSRTGVKIYSNITATEVAGRRETQ
jgi:hypothetical protein